MSGQGLLERILNDQSIVTGMLVVIAVCSLTFAYRHLRPLAGRRHLPAHSGGPAAVGGRWAGGDPWMSPPPRVAAGIPRPAVHSEPAAVHPPHAEDYPSWPGHQEPYWPDPRPQPSGARPSGVMQIRPAVIPVQSQAGRPGPPVLAPDPVWDAGSVQLATWILDEANAQAAEIRHEARDEVAASLAEAKKEAAELLRQASDQAAAKLAAAEHEAAGVQAAVMKLSSELGAAAAHVTTRPSSPAAPAVRLSAQLEAATASHPVA
jgi:hypothetical protein